MYSLCKVSIFVMSSIKDVWEWMVARELHKTKSKKLKITLEINAKKFFFSLVISLMTIMSYPDISRSIGLEYHK